MDAVYPYKFPLIENDYSNTPVAYDGLVIMEEVFLLTRDMAL
jgi:hypothetical protein